MGLSHPPVRRPRPRPRARPHRLPRPARRPLPPLKAIRAATTHGPLALGAQAPRSGVLAEGYDAEVITLDADPLDDITAMSDPDHVTGVWKAGRRVKGA
ncbi:amidohydrolase family protein [Nonomuraea dietziae]|uniref:amidohydrolase family protein n=1 Tax=Nonomuraea dietziae TaxID=65515 RepID=UPI001C85525B|nr:amidohydrolase family protein [Nonomuraea dietziae]